MDRIIEVREADCRSCYRCIRHCALKAISCREDRTEILREECVYSVSYTNLTLPTT